VVGARHGDTPFNPGYSGRQKQEDVEFEAKARDPISNTKYKQKIWEHG
jgi:hypothetical protein